MSGVPPLYGLILAGGASTRMQQDKAALTYHGKTQLQWTYELAARFCDSTFVSVRPDQRTDPARAGFPQIVDRQPGIGPIAGISAALSEHPGAAWLVIACDLPFITPQVLEHLIEQRDPQRVATAYKSSHDGLPEPLCAIWEPAAREPVEAHIAAGKKCPRKFLINADVKLLELPDKRALENVNTPAELEAAKQELSMSKTSSAAAASGKSEPRARTLRIQYYAVLREQAKRSEETVDTTASTPAELYEELRKRHPFQLAPAQLKVAINADFRDWNTPLANGDTVVFIPPVAGG
jgi:molybdopterin-guanine dinucleotide biosynthesis protein A